MRSTHVYRTIREAVDPWCEANGFTRAAAAPLAYCKPIGGKFLSVWFQCDRHGWDPYSGSRFTVEFQLDGSPEPGKPANDRLQRFLTAEELEFVRDVQNSIIRKIPPPPQAWVDSFESNARRLYKNPELLIEGFWEQWRPVSAPLQPEHDLWLRYWEADDVTTWAALILNVLPRIVAQYSEAQSFEPSA